VPVEGDGSDRRERPALLHLLRDRLAVRADFASDAVDDDLRRENRSPLPYVAIVITLPGGKRLVGERVQPSPVLPVRQDVPVVDMPGESDDILAAGQIG